MVWVGRNIKTPPIPPLPWAGALDQVAPTLSKPALDSPRDRAGCLY